MHEDYHVGYFGDERLKKTAVFSSNEYIVSRRFVCVGSAETERMKLNSVVG